MSVPVVGKAWECCTGLGPDDPVGAYGPTLPPAGVAAWKPSPASCAQHRGREWSGIRGLFSSSPPRGDLRGSLGRLPPADSRGPPLAPPAPQAEGIAVYDGLSPVKGFFADRFPGRKEGGRVGMAAEGTARTRGAVGGVQCLSPLWGKRGSVPRGWAQTTGWELSVRSHPRQGWVRENRRRRAAPSTGAGSGSGSGDFSPAAPAPRRPARFSWVPPSCRFARFPPWHRPPPKLRG